MKEREVERGRRLMVRQVKGWDRIKGERGGDNILKGIEEMINYFACHVRQVMW
jgi:hypothetical protein